MKKSDLFNGYPVLNGYLLSQIGNIVIGHNVFPSEIFIPLSSPVEKSYSLVQKFSHNENVYKPQNAYIRKPAPVLRQMPCNRVAKTYDHP